MSLAFGVILLLLASTGAFNYYATKHLVAAAKDIENDLKKKTLATLIDVAVRRQIWAANYFTFTGDKVGLQRYSEAKQDVVRDISQTNELLSTETGKALLAKVQEAAERTSAVTDKQIALRQASRNYEATDLAFNPKTAEVIKGLMEALAALEAREDQRAQSGLDAEHSVQSTNERVMLILVLVGLGIGTGTALFMARSLVGGITVMLATIEEIAGNNLAIGDVEITSTDEIGQAGLALNRMKNNLREVIQAIASTAEHVASASEQISASA
ncbi:MAG: methyl-accepting chemotaxis protein, partial [Terriglobales bacterium]